MDYIRLGSWCLFCQLSESLLNKKKKMNHLREMVYFGIPYETDNTKEDERLEFGGEQRF